MTFFVVGHSFALGMLWDVFFTSQAEKIDHGTCTFFPFKVSTAGQKPFLLLGRGGIGEILVPFDSHEVVFVSRDACLMALLCMAFRWTTQQSVEAILLSLLQIRSVPWSFGNTEFG